MIPVARDQRGAVMLKARYFRSVCNIVFALLSMSALLARGGTPDGYLTSASLSLYCNGGYCLSVNATDLPVGEWYTIDYSFTVTCSGGISIPVSNSFTFQATAFTETVPIQGTLGTTLSGSCDVTNGKATITSSGSTVYFTGSKMCPTPQLMETCPALTGTVGVPYNSCTVASGGVPPYSFNIASGTIPPGLTGSKITGCITGTPTEAGTFTDVFFVTDSTGARADTPACPIVIGPPVPTACVIPPIDSAIAGAPVSWNGFKAPAGSVVWVHAHISGATNVPTNTTTTVDFTGVTLVVNKTTYALPNGQILFVPGTTTPTTVVNADGSWTTTVSPSFTGDIFFDGQAIPVDANLENGGSGNTSSTFSFTTNSSDSNLKFSWQWSAAVYTSWPGNAAANIEPVHAQLQAGAPQNKAVEADLIQGPRGGGGSNFTGSWSGTGHGVCPY